MKRQLVMLMLIFSFLSFALYSEATPISPASILNPGFEDVGSDPGDGLRTTANWNFSSVRAARAFAGRDGINTGSGGYMRLITEGTDRGDTWQDITGSTDLNTLYTFAATAYSSPNSLTNLADFQVTMKLLEIGRSTTVGGATVDHAFPVLLDSQTLAIAALGGSAPISVSYLDDSNGFDLELRIQFESADVLPIGVFTRGGVDNVTLTTLVVPEPAGLGLLLIGLVGLLVVTRRQTLSLC